MSKMGSYCKAYPVKQLRSFAGWTEDLAQVRVDKTFERGKELQTQRTIADDDYFYLQENYVVTDGIFLDENIIFNNVTPEWTQYCKEILKFEIPVYESAAPA
ncbi:MAG TPA: hypothetical protein VJX67_10980 [Blastocatellia bacterium]|nr:hypothetical protein [Blastocatellia bacterium]